MTVLVGIDVGASATKGVAIDPDGEVIARAKAEYPLSTPRPGWAEQDPEDWWRASETVLGELAAAAGDPVERPAHPGRMRGDRADDRA